MNGSTELYLEHLLRRNKLAKQFGFKLRKVSGIDGLEELMADSKLESCVALDLTNDGRLYQSQGGGFYEVRVQTIFILRRYEYARMPSLDTALSVCRNLFRQLLAQMVVDSKVPGSPMGYLNVSQVNFRELSPELGAHSTGLYFMLEFDEPYNLVYDEQAWERQ